MNIWKNVECCVLYHKKTINHNERYNVYEMFDISDLIKFKVFQTLKKLYLN